VRAQRLSTKKGKFGYGVEFALPFVISFTILISVKDGHEHYDAISEVTNYCSD
jgi:hypothetical protein